MAEHDKVFIERDLRLDLFRGVGLWMIFLDHIPHDVVSWLTLRNYGFSDAAEFFVFISGYLAGFIYGPIVKAGHFLAALKRLWKRAIEMYVAHIMLFLVFTAQIARTVRKFDNPLYEDEFNVHNFLLHPDVLIGQALTLRYKPVNLDVLPLYITLIATAPFMLWAMVRRPNLTLSRFDRALCFRAQIRLEPRILSARHQLVFQSLRLAVDVHLRRLVRHRRREQDLADHPVAPRARRGVAMALVRLS